MAVNFGKTTYLPPKAPQTPVKFEGMKANQGGNAFSKVAFGSDSIEKPDADVAAPASTPEKFKPVRSLVLGAVVDPFLDIAKAFWNAPLASSFIIATTGALMRANKFVRATMTLTVAAYGAFKIASNGKAAYDQVKAQKDKPVEQKDYALANKNLREVGEGALLVGLTGKSAVEGAQELSGSFSKTFGTELGIMGKQAVASTKSTIASVQDGSLLNSIKSAVGLAPKTVAAEAPQVAEAVAPAVESAPATGKASYSFWQNLYSFMNLEQDRGAVAKAPKTAVEFFTEGRKSLNKSLDALVQTLFPSKESIANLEKVKQHLVDIKNLVSSEQPKTANEIVTGLEQGIKGIKGLAKESPAIIKLEEYVANLRAGMTNNSSADSFVALRPEQILDLESMIGSVESSSEATTGVGILRTIVKSVTNSVDDLKTTQKGVSSSAKNFLSVLKRVFKGDFVEAKAAAQDAKLGAAALEEGKAATTIADEVGVATGIAADQVRTPGESAAMLIKKGDETT